MTNEKLVNVPRRGQKRKSIQPTKIQKNGSMRGAKDGLPRTKPSTASPERPHKSENSDSLTNTLPGKLNHRTISATKNPENYQKVSKSASSAKGNSIDEDIPCTPSNAARSGKARNSPRRSKELGTLSRNSKPKGERVRKTNALQRKGRSEATLPSDSGSDVVEKTIARVVTPEEEEGNNVYSSSFYSNEARDHKEMLDKEHWHGRPKKLCENTDLNKRWGNETDQSREPIGDITTAEWESTLTQMIEKIDETSLPSKNTNCLDSYCAELKPEKRQKEPKRDALRPRRRKGRDANKGQYKRRLIANARERNRVHTLGRAFEDLRGAIPSFSEDQKLSKLTILKLAISYISALDNLLHYNESSEARLLFAENVNDCTGALQTEYGRAKRKYRGSSDTGHY